MLVPLETAVHLIRSGSVLAVPTDTVYGLAASLEHVEAIKHIYALKKRPPNKSVVIQVAAVDQIYAFILHEPPGFKELAQRYWPGALTIVLPIKETMVPAEARSGLLTAGFRIPAHTELCALLERTGPLVITSANISGEPTVSSIHEIEMLWGKDFPILKGDVPENGKSSTVVEHSEGVWNVLRQGALTL